MRKSVLSVLMLVGLFAGHLALASPAAAASDCKQSGTDYGGVTLTSCIFVDGSNGRATTTVTWNAAAPDTSIRPVATIVRNNGGVEVRQTNNNCQWKAMEPGTSGSVTCNAYLPNLADSQAWRSDAQVYIFLSDSSPDLLRSGVVAA